MGAVTITRTADPAGVNSVTTTTTYSSVAVTGGTVVVLGIGKEIATITVSSVTVNYGAGAESMVLGAGTTFGSNGAWWYWHNAPVGATSAEFIITWSGTGPTSVQNHISVYCIVNGAFPPRVASTNTSTDMDVTTPLTTGAQTINTNGGALAFASCAADATAKTWANITEDLDADAGDFRWTTASRVTALAATAMTCTGGTNNEDGVLAYLIVDEAVLPDVTAAPYRSIGS